MLFSQSVQFSQVVKLNVYIVLLFALSACGDGKVENEEARQLLAAKLAQKNVAVSMSHEGTSDSEGYFSPMLAGDARENLIASFDANKQRHPGSSKRGFVFDEGPRQSLPLTERHPQVQFPAIFCKMEANEYFHQGIAQLHAFKNYEAERSFRQAFALDGNCVMAIWGAALSQIVFKSGNVARGAKFAKLAAQLSKRVSLNPLNQKLVDGLNAAFSPDLTLSDRGRLQFTKILYREASTFKDDELKALAILFVWELGEKKAKSELGVTFQDLSNWIDEIHSRKEMHPLHHHKIHIWNDTTNEDRTLKNATLIGPSYREAAHMWHMGSHTYMGVSQFQEANVQFEAAQRIDNAWAEKNLEFPYLLHNYAHNASYWIFGLMAQGQEEAAERVALDMMALPFHPLYNNPETFSSSYHSPYLNGADTYLTASYAHGAFSRILEWEKRGLIRRLLNFENPKLNGYKAYLLHVLCLLHMHNGNSSIFERYKTELTATPADKSKTLLAKIDTVEKWIATPTKENFEKVKKAAGYYDYHFLSMLAMKNDLLFEAEVLINIKTAAWLNRSFSAHLIKAEIAHRTGRDAKEEFAIVQRMAFMAEEKGDRYKRATALSKNIGSGLNWRLSEELDQQRELPPQDLGKLHSPQLAAPPLRLPDHNNSIVDLVELTAKYEQVIVNFVLGGNCLNCNQQVLDFIKKREVLPAHTAMIFVTTDTQKDLHFFLEKSDLTKVPHYYFLSDATHEAFKAYKVYDDFEAVPLHGTFVIGKNGMISWLDRGAQPFTDLEWISNEILRKKQMSSFAAAAKSFQEFKKDPRYK